MALFRNPGEEDYEGLLAENRFISDIQLAIEAALADRNMSQSDLARLMKVSPARVSQMLASNGANVTARTVARIAHVLGVRACVALTEESLDGWWQETHEDAAPVKQFADWVRVACETIEENGMTPGAPSNDAWSDTAKPSTDASEADNADHLVAA